MHEVQVWRYVRCAVCVFVYSLTSCTHVRTSGASAVASSSSQRDSIAHDIRCAQTPNFSTWRRSVAQNGIVIVVTV